MRTFHILLFGTILSSVGVIAMEPHTEMPDEKTVGSPARDVTSLEYLAKVGGFKDLEPYTLEWEHAIINGIESHEMSDAEKLRFMEHWFNNSSNYPFPHRMLAQAIVSAHDFPLGTKKRACAFVLSSPDCAVPTKRDAFIFLEKNGGVPGNMRESAMEICNHETRFGRAGKKTWGNAAEYLLNTSDPWEKVKKTMGKTAAKSVEEFLQTHISEE